jgi:single-strand DNA-binding protein
MINKVILIGNVGVAPDIKEVNGKKLAKFSLATQSGFGDNKTTDWHNIVVWEKTAEVVERFVNKGDKIYIEGRIQYGKYEKDGITRYTTDIVCERLQLMGGVKPQQQTDSVEPTQTEPIDSLPF